MKRTRTKIPGIYTRKSEHRKHEGKSDVCFDISYKREGRKIWEKVGWASEGYSLKLASNIRAERLRMIRHGQELPREKAKIPRFSEMAELYLNWSEENKSDSNDRSRYENYLKEPLGNKRLNEISSFEIEKVKSDLLKKNLAPATVKHALSLIRAIYNKAAVWGRYEGANPIKGVKFPTLNNRRERFLSIEEAQRLLDTLKKGSITTHEISLLSLHTGLRAGEIFRLKGIDLDFENGLINISDPKNKTSRKAFMTNEVKKILKARMPEDPNELVFRPRNHDDQIKRVSGFFQRTADSLFNQGVEDPRQRVVFHTLRHTFASWLAIQGTPILAIKELLGHKSLAMTERYSHLIPDTKREAILSLEKNFRAKVKGKVAQIRTP